jgi:hypothetical protein
VALSTQYSRALSGQRDSAQCVILTIQHGRDIHYVIKLSYSLELSFSLPANTIKAYRGSVSDICIELCSDSARKG